MEGKDERPAGSQVSTACVEDGQLIADWLKARYKGGYHLPDLWEAQSTADERHADAVQCYGGNKVLEACVRIGAFNNFDVKEFYSAVADLPLEEEVKIFVQKQHENVFTLGLVLP